MAPGKATTSQTQVQPNKHSSLRSLYAQPYQDKHGSLSNTIANTRQRKGVICFDSAFHECKATIRDTKGLPKKQTSIQKTADAVMLKTPLHIALLLQDVVFEASEHTRSKLTPKAARLEKRLTSSSGTSRNFLHPVFAWRFFLTSYFIKFWVVFHNHCVNMH